MNAKVHFFPFPIDSIALPAQFTYPFHYTPHTLTELAAKEVQIYLQSRKDWAEELQEGKMFGVLIVRTPEKRIGYLAAFSGNLAGSNHHSFFVPPVYDMLQPDGFFRQEEKNISAINLQIKKTENSSLYLEGSNHHSFFVPPVYDMLQPDGFFRQEEKNISAINLQIKKTENSSLYLDMKNELNAAKQYAAAAIAQYKEALKKAKSERDERRKSGISPEEETLLIRESQHQKASFKRKEKELQNFIKEKQAKSERDERRKSGISPEEETLLIRESQHQKASFKRKEKELQNFIKEKQGKVRQIEETICLLKQERKKRSAALQEKLFGQFRMLNAKGERKDLCELFK